MDLSLEVNAVLPRLFELQREIHTHPEASFKEVLTTKRILQFCKELGLEIIDTGLDTGVVAILHPLNKPNQAVALRADIDAVTLDNEVMHSCGHDYHTVSLLGCAAVLSNNRDKLKRDVVFIFQPAEEITRGARAMLNSGFLEKLPVLPNRLFGIHNRPEIPVGKIRVCEGALMAVKSNFKINIFGKTGHAGSPHQCNDPIVACAGIINAVQTVISRNTDPFEPCVCAICSVHSGSEENFAPDVATMTGAIRALNTDTHDLCAKRLEAICNEISGAYNCRASFELIREVPVLYNSFEMTELARIAAEKTVGKDNIVCTRGCLGSEDFSVWSEKIPSFFFWVGSGKENTENAPWHSRDFTVADGYLEVAVKLLVNCALLE